MFERSKTVYALDRAVTVIDRRESEPAISSPSRQKPAICLGPLTSIKSVLIHPNSHFLHFNIIVPFVITYGQNFLIKF
jgi:hypothetical protein